MIDKQEGCDPILLERYFDGEVGESERERIEAHVSVCAACRSHLEGNRAVAEQMRTLAAHRLTAAQKNLMENRLVEQAGKRRIRFAGGRRSLLRPGWLIPAGAAVGAFLLFLTLFSRPDPAAGPSAIVTSFEGDYTSLMIVETPDTRSTIIWFDEAS